MSDHKVFLTPPPIYVRGIGILGLRSSLYVDVASRLGFLEESPRLFLDLEGAFVALARVLASTTRIVTCDELVSTDLAVNNVEFES